MPLRAWRVQNFKSIREAELTFAPLTLLVGPNSSGKTSLLQSILLVAQAAQGGNQGSTFPLNGPLTSVGSFEEVRFAHSKSGAVGIGAIVQLPIEAPRAAVASEGFQSRLAGIGDAGLDIGITAKWWTTLDGPAVNEPGSADVASVELEVKQADPTLSTGRAHLRLSAARRGQGQIEEDVERLRLGSLALPMRERFALGFSGQLSADELGDVPIRGLALQATLPHNVLTTWRLGDAAASVWSENRIIRPFWSASRGLGASARDLAPFRATPAMGEADIQKWADEAAREITEWDRLRQDEPTSLPAFLSRRRRTIPPEERLALRNQIDGLVAEIRGKVDMQNEVFLPPEGPVSGWLGDVMSDVHSFLSERVIYLGPLRQEPQSAGEMIYGGAAGFIGTKGEHLATVLHAARSSEVVSFDERGAPEPTSLSEAVNKWTARLQIVDNVQTRDLGRLGIQISVRRGGVGPVDLTGVGVGVSQLLPVIVTCLLAEPGALILLEQPELHLHPALQQRLADFLLGCARSGRQLIVETHSEYLVSRLRRRVAEDNTGELVEALAVFFVEQANDESTFRRVAVNEFGGVEDWPVGFFDQAATESRKILEAGLEKRNRRLGQAGARVSS
jgi:predicted ATPase